MSKDEYTTVGKTLEGLVSHHIQRLARNKFKT